jgi:hypothetical protein
VIRIERTLVDKPGSTPKQSSALLRKGATAPAQQMLEVAYDPQHDPGRAYDKDAAFNQEYRYTAQRIQTLTLSGHKIEIASEASPAVTLNTRDIFPPTDTVNDLAGYVVYRREAGSATAPTRISPAQPIPGPAFRDSTATAGKGYAYSVSAIDQDKNESQRSAEVEESLPQ